MSIYILTEKTDYRSHNPEFPTWRTLGVNHRVNASGPAAAVLKFLETNPESRVISIQRKAGISIKDLVAYPLRFARRVFGDITGGDEIKNLSHILRLTESRQGVLKEPDADYLPWLMPQEGNDLVGDAAPSDFTKDGIFKGDATKERGSDVHHGTLDASADSSKAKASIAKEVLETQSNG